MGQYFTIVAPCVLHVRRKQSEIHGLQARRAIEDRQTGQPLSGVTVVQWVISGKSGIARSPFGAPALTTR